MQERLQKILSRAGVASRRKAEDYIRQGRVTVNGRVAALGDSADPSSDEILLDGTLLGKTPESVYIMLNKPRGYVTTLSDERGRKTVRELVDCGTRVYPVGRLDMDSEGLLLLTNDGELANILIHPGHMIEKTYEVWVNGYTPVGLAAMKTPMVIDGYRIHPAKVSLRWQKDSDARLTVTIHEGRNRQIRKMAERSGMTVTRLLRVAEGPLRLGKLPKGQWRYLTENEISILHKIK